MSDSEMADLVAGLVAGTNGTVRPLAAETRAELERFARRLLVNPEVQDAYFPLRKEAYGRHGVTERDTAGLPPPTSDELAVSYLGLLLKEGLGALSDSQLLGLLNCDETDLDIVAEVIAEEYYASGTLAREWTEATDEFLASLPPLDPLAEERLTALARKLARRDPAG